MENIIVSYFLEWPKMLAEILPNTLDPTTTVIAFYPALLMSAFFVGSMASVQTCVLAFNTALGYFPQDPFWGKLLGLSTPLILLVDVGIGFGALVWLGEKADKAMGINAFRRLNIIMGIAGTAVLVKEIARYKRMRRK